MIKTTFFDHIINIKKNIQKTELLHRYLNIKEKKNSSISEVCDLSRISICRNCL